MKLNLFVKVYLSLFLIMTFIFILYGLLNLSDQKKSLLKIMQIQANNIVKSLYLSNIENLISNDPTTLIKNSLEFLKDNKSIEYIIFNKKDKEKLLIYTDKWEIRANLDKNYLKFEKDKVAFNTLKSNHYGKNVFHYVHPIKISLLNWGWVHVGFSLKEYKESIEKIYNNFLIMTIVLSIFSIIFTYIFTKWLLRPILELTNKTQEISNGNFNEIVKVKSDDEIGMLTQNFNSMIISLKKSQDQLYEAKEDLEIKVQKRTHELEELNKNLDNKVNEEVEKRRKQDKILQNQLKMAQMGEMLNNIAHQWRQPLSVITSVISAAKLENDLRLSSKRDFKNNYELIMKNANYLTKIIDAFTKYTDEEHTIENIDLKNVINDLLILNGDILKKNFVSVVLDYDKNEKFNITTSPSFLSQVLLNILLNANNAFSKSEINDKKIWIKLENKNNLFYISIKDNAGGIDKKIIDKIFEPYFTTKHQGQGTGMGLYLSYDIVVNQLEGNISVENIQKGAQFTIVLPKIIT